MTISTKVTANQKAEYSKIARLHNLTLSEWVCSIMEMNKDSYGKVCDPTKRETELEQKLHKSEKKVSRLTTNLENADYKVSMEMKSNDDLRQINVELRHSLKLSNDENADLLKQVKELETEKEKTSNALNGTYENIDKFADDQEWSILGRFDADSIRKMKVL